MKKLIFFCLFALLNSFLIAQAPEAFTYQGIAMDKAGNVIANQQLGIEISIVQDSHDGELLYTEIHNPTTTADGHFTIAVGRGQTLMGFFPRIDWGLHRHFIAIAMDLSGGANYQFVGSTELLAVPYAFHTKVSGNRRGITGPSGPAGPTGATGPTAIHPPDGCCLGNDNKGPDGAPGPSGMAGMPGSPGKAGLANVKKTAIIPDNPVNGQIYLDDGTNRTDGKVGFRYYDINQWIDL